MNKYIFAAFILLSSCKKDNVPDTTVADTTAADTTAVDMTPIDAKGEILFLSRISSIPEYKVFLMNADGTNQKAVSNSVAICAPPVLSNSKTKIAFTIWENDYECLYVVDKDGQTRNF